MVSMDLIVEVKPEGMTVRHDHQGLSIPLAKRPA